MNTPDDEGTREQAAPVFVLVIGAVVYGCRIVRMGVDVPAGGVVVGVEMNVARAETTQDVGAEKPRRRD